MGRAPKGIESCPNAVRISASHGCTIARMGHPLPDDMLRVTEAELQEKFRT